MTTFGHLLIVFMWVAGLLGAILGMAWLRYKREKGRSPDWMRRQPP